MGNVRALLFLTMAWSGPALAWLGVDGPVQHVARPRHSRPGGPRRPLGSLRPLRGGLAEEAGGRDGPRWEYLTDEQARRELAEAGVMLGDASGADVPTESAVRDLEDIVHSSEHEDIEEPPVALAPGQRKGLLTSNPQELKQNYPDVYSLLAEKLGDPSAGPRHAAPFGAASYAFSDTLAQAQRFRREATRVASIDKDFGAFLSEGTGPDARASVFRDQHALLLFGLSPDDEDVEVVSQVAAPDFLVPEDVASVGEALGVLDPGQMVVVTANTSWYGVLDVHAPGTNLAGDHPAVFFKGAWTFWPSSSGSLTSVAAICGEQPAPAAFHVDDGGGCGQENRHLGVSASDSLRRAVDGAEEAGGCDPADRHDSTTMLVLGGPWLLRASSIVSEGGWAAVTAAGSASLHLAGCVVGGARGVSSSAHGPAPFPEEGGVEGGEMVAREGGGGGEGAGDGGVECTSSSSTKGLSQEGPVLGVSLLGRCVFDDFFVMKRTCAWIFFVFVCACVCVYAP